MTISDFRKLVESKIVVLDGATGSNLQKAGMPVGVCPEEWILENPQVLIDMQKEYIKAGTDILYAATFACNRVKLKEYGLDDKIKEMNLRLVELSKKAILESKLEGDREVYIAGNLTMTGRQLHPVGDMDFELLVDVYKEQVMYLLMAGVDLIVVETMMSLNECRAAVLAVKEISDLPVMVTMTFQENNRTFYGTDPGSAILVLQSMGVDAVGINCSTGPDKMLELVNQMRTYARLPIIVKANAGLPTLVEDETVFSMGAEVYTEYMMALIKAGARIVGGCCGTTPEHIRILKEAIHDCEQDIVIKNWNEGSVRALATEQSVLDIPLEGEFLVIGERINPTGKKLLQEELKNEIFDTVIDMAISQVDSGAKILDINMGMNGIDEKNMMLQGIVEITRAVDVPLSIDSSHVEVIETALRRYPGRALINSITLEEDKLSRLLAIAKKYGAMFILLPLSGAGLPKDNDEKNQIINTIIERAELVGLYKEDIIVDGLVNTIGANKMAAYETLQTIDYCKNTLEVATVVGLSNISFGLPERQYVNSTFLGLSIFSGLTMAIANPSQNLLMNTASAANLLQGTEDSDNRYIETVRKENKNIKSNPLLLKEFKEEVIKQRDEKIDVKIDIEDNKETNLENRDENIPNEENSQDKRTRLKEHPLFQGVIKGNKRNILSLLKTELNKGEHPKEILDHILIPAINYVGELFDQQIYFLPQLISSAETMKMAIDNIEPLLEKNVGTAKGKVVIATVAGDVHDIGKNLVSLMLKNYGYEILDMGKDVPSSKIIQIAKEVDADIIALSALMTTTMLEMKEVIRLRNEEGIRSKVIIGGAVITESYAYEIGADGYGKDAGDTVRMVEQLMSK